jgi:glycosyltransferase involved in cell wall biosynthesis
VRAAVIIPTYNDPRGLSLCLEGLARQKVMPDEIAIADDGSGEETRTLVEHWKTRLPCSLHHAWHPDEGNRKAEICNKAASLVTSEQLIFIDGDSIPHSRWVSDHLLATSRGDVRCGRRVKLGPDLTQRVDSEMVSMGRLESLMGPLPWSALRGDTRRFPLGQRLPSALARLLHRRPRKLMGVNFSVSRKAFATVNGYDTEWNHRRQDKDLGLRLSRAGFCFVPLLNRAVVYHLFHGETPTSDFVEARVEAEEASDRIRCKVGLDSYG